MTPATFPRVDTRKAPPQRRNRGVTLPQERCLRWRVVTAAISSSVGLKVSPATARWTYTHDALGVDHEHRPPVEAERAEDAVGLAHRLVLVGEQREARSRRCWHENSSWLSTDCGLMASTCGADVGEPVDVLGVASLSCRVHTGVLSPG